MQTALKEDKAVIILDGLDFRWWKREIDEAISLWEAGVSLRQMVDKLRPVDTNLYRSYSEREAEVFMLLMHLGLEGRLKERPGGIFGGCKHG